MPSSFHAISPPPQTLESTGEWGDLDSLLWSLDDPRWLTIGVYGVRGTETAHTDQSAKIDGRIRLVFGAAEAAASGWGFVSATRHLSGETGGRSAGRAAPDRILHLKGMSSAESSESGTAFRVRPASGSTHAQATETEGPRRVRLFAAPAEAFSSGSLSVLRARRTSGESSAQSGEGIVSSIKGHNWKDEALDMGSWDQFSDGTARDWAPFSSAHATDWRGIVQWP